jgi:hypothetical protein
MNNKIFLVLPFLFLSGCQTSTRPYDGVLGYKTTPVSDSVSELTYVDEDKRSWDEVEVRARKACARSLKTKPDQALLGIQSRTQFSQLVAMPVAIPMSPGAASKKGMQRPGPIPSGVVIQGTASSHAFDIEMNLKKLVTTCELATKT